MSYSDSDNCSKVQWLRWNNPIMWASLATVLFVLLLVLLGGVPTCNAELFPKGSCPPKWKHIVAAPINEVGDTLAGLAGVLAFIWLVATVMLQAHELSEQRKEFRGQRKATQDMAKAMQEQASVFQDEMRQRSEKRAEALLDMLLAELAQAAATVPTVSWGTRRTFQDGSISISSEWLYGPEEETIHSKDFPLSFAKVIGQERSRILLFHSEGVIDSYPDSALISGAIEPLVSILESIELLDLELSEAQQVRVKCIGVKELKITLEDMAGKPELWRWDHAEEIDRD